MRTRIGECLVHAGLITEEGLRKALAEQQRSGDRLGAVLVRMNLATEPQIADALAGQLGFPRVVLSDNPPNPTAIGLIPKEVALTRLCVGVALENHVLTVAMADPLLFSLVQDLEFQTGRRVKQAVATRSEILAAIQSGYPDVVAAQTASSNSFPLRRDIGARSVSEPIERLRERAETPAVVDLVDRLVDEAIERQATDVHVEPTETGVLIRYRLDGLLKSVKEHPLSVHGDLVARLKLMSGLDIAETRLPQAGRLRAHGGVEFRASTLRTLFGEKVVLRVRDHCGAVPRLEELGLSASSLELVRKLSQHEHGMILAAGPSGSGRTTTVCAALSARQSAGRNAVTVEESLEYQMPGVTQTLTDDGIGLTCEGALRSVLQQDPDVILVGEIRDAVVAALAMEAQIDHLVLSTVSADDAPSAVTRLADFGIDMAPIGSAVNGVVAQRLVRRLCPHCRRQYVPPDDLRRRLGLGDAEASTVLYRAIGCDQCNHTGYRGRIGVFEVMRVTDALRRVIAARASDAEIRAQAIADGMVTLGEDALSKVKSGVTTAEELLRVVPDGGERRPVCAGCGTAVGADFTVCPSCGSRLGGGCSHCGRALQPGWNFCPYCARGTEPARPSGLRREREASEGNRRTTSANVAEFKKP
jgi:type IV pilus assembly protein PilB